MKAARGDGFEAVFDELLDVAERVARRVVGPTDADDVAAEVLSTVLLRRSRLAELPYLPAWVARPRAVGGAGRTALLLAHDRNELALGVDVRQTVHLDDDIADRDVAGERRL